MRSGLDMAAILNFASVSIVSSDLFLPSSFPGDLTKHLLSVLSDLDETHSGSILFACVETSYLLLHIDRICGECSGFSIQFSGLD
jgi:hypothetical protein